MTLHITINSDGLGKKICTENLDRGLFALVNQAHSDMNLYAPKREGELRKQSFAQENRITYEVPYAKAQYRGYFYTKTGKKIQFKKYKETGTGSHWDKRAKANHMNGWRKAFVEGGKFNGH